jgi:hypothetical protein
LGFSATRVAEKPKPPEYELQQPIMSMLTRHLERRREARDD